MRKRHHPALSWPRLQAEDRIACPLCDALQPAPRLQEGECACCGHCGEVLFNNRPRSLSRATGFSSAALVFMALSHLFPFLTMEAAGSRTQLSLIASSSALVENQQPLLAGLVFVFTVIAPLVLAASLLYLTAPLMYGFALPGSRRLARWMQASEPWAMLEVFLLGFIVSLLKLGHVAEIAFNIGLWALAAVVFCLAAALGGVDRRELWDRLEIARTRSRAMPAPENANPAS